MTTPAEPKKNTVLVTESLCPVCLKKIEARILRINNQYKMVKRCDEHGTFETLVWKGTQPMESWIRHKSRGGVKHPRTNVRKGCPYDCGPCKDHRQETCTALIEVTQACNLNCKFCFANASKARMNDEPDLLRLRKQFINIKETTGYCNIQLSGGEPTIRNDLPEIIAIGKELGFPFIQVNTNGVRLAQDEAYVKALKRSGLDSIFLQFDGTREDINIQLRREKLLDIKNKAIDLCAKYEIGVILVPTIVPGINSDNLGEMINYGIKKMPAVRGIHFQPVSYFGRVPKIPEDKDRITLMELMDQICKQTNGKITMENLKPPGCENSLCSFHGNFIVHNNELKPLTKQIECCTKTDGKEGAAKAKAFVADKWKYKKVTSKKVQSAKIDDWDTILDALHNRTFCISGMAFQDVWNINLERVRDCCIHVSTDDGRLIPFCMYNLTDCKGYSLYR